MFTEFFVCDYEIFCIAILNSNASHCFKVPVFSEFSLDLLAENSTLHTSQKEVIGFCSLSFVYG